MRWQAIFRNQAATAQLPTLALLNDEPHGSSIETASWQSIRARPSAVEKGLHAALCAFRDIPPAVDALGPTGALLAYRSSLALALKGISSVGPLSFEYPSLPLDFPYGNFLFGSRDSFIASLGLPSYWSGLAGFGGLQDFRVVDVIALIAIVRSVVSVINRRTEISDLSGMSFGMSPIAVGLTPHGYLACVGTSHIARAREEYRRISNLVFCLADCIVAHFT